MASARAESVDPFLVVPIKGLSSPVAAADGERTEHAQWEAWNTLRTLCEHNASLGVLLGKPYVVFTLAERACVRASGAHMALRVSSAVARGAEITEDLPSRDVLLRWLGEPIKAIVVPTSIFLTNKKGYPVLSRVSDGRASRISYAVSRCLVLSCH